MRVCLLDYIMGRPSPPKTPPRRAPCQVHEERFKEPVLAVLRKAGFTNIQIESSAATLTHGVYNLWATRG